jgi:hypothetical protein
LKQIYIGGLLLPRPLPPRALLLAAASLVLVFFLTARGTSSESLSSIRSRFFLVLVEDDPEIVLELAVPPLICCVPAGVRFTLGTAGFFFFDSFFSVAFFASAF